MPRISVVFALSEARAQSDLLREFALHDGVEAVAHDVDGRPAIRVELRDVMGALWDVRATVGMYDEAAVEIGDQG